MKVTQETKVRLCGTANRCKTCGFHVHSEDHEKGGHHHQKWTPDVKK